MRVVSVELDLWSHSIGVRFPYSFIYNIKQEMRRGDLVTVAEPIAEKDRDWNTFTVIKINDSTYAIPRDGDLVFLTEEHPFFNIRAFVKLTRHLLRENERTKISLGVRDQLYKLTLDAKKR